MEINRPDDQKETVTASLPDDIVHYNILPRVPAESLLRFKCVSKDWYHLTKNPVFIGIYQKHALETCDCSDSFVVCLGYNKKGSLCLYMYLDASHAVCGRNVVIETVVFDVQISSSSIVGSCNGLICLETYLAQVYERVNLSLCNPLTGECRRLADPPSVPSNPLGCFAYGFGYDCVSHDYKIARIIPPSGGWSTSVIIQVYSTSTRSWRETKGVTPFDFTDLYGSGVCLNSTLHWIVRDQKQNFSILTFDFRSEEFGKMQLPNNKELSFFNTLVVSRGLIYYLWTSYASSEHSIWVMKKYGVSESWTKLYTFTGKDVKLDRYVVPLFSYRSEKGGFGGKAVVKVSARPNEFIWYNCEDKSTTKVDVINYRGLPYEQPYVRSQPWVCTASIAPIL